MGVDVTLRHEMPRTQTASYSVLVDAKQSELVQLRELWHDSHQQGQDVEQCVGGVESREEAGYQEPANKNKMNKHLLRQGVCKLSHTTGTWRTSLTVLLIC